MQHRVQLILLKSSYFSSKYFNKSISIILTQDYIETFIIHSAFAEDIKKVCLVHTGY